MPQYEPPLKDISFILNEVLNVEQLSGLEGYEDVSAELVEQIVEEGGKICKEVLFPLMCQD